MNEIFVDLDELVEISEEIITCLERPEFTPEDLSVLDILIQKREPYFVQCKPLSQCSNVVDNESQKKLHIVIELNDKILNLLIEKRKILSATLYSTIKGFKGCDAYL